MRRIFTTAENLVFPVKKMTHKKVTLAKVTAKNDPPESTRWKAIYLWYDMYRGYIEGIVASTLRP